MSYANRFLITITAGALATGISTQALAAPPDGGHGHPLAAIFLEKPLLTSIDTDGDGSVSDTEFSTARTAQFNAIDTDTSGSVSFTEFHSGFITRINSRFTTLDTSVDSNLDITEFLAAINRQASKIRTDSAQRQPPFDLSTVVSNLFKQADADANSLINLAEYTAIAEKIVSPVMPFVRQDTDGDGSLSLGEFSQQPPHRRPTAPLSGGSGAGRPGKPNRR